METIQSWKKMQRLSYVTEETGILKMSDGYTLEDLATISGYFVDWEYLDDYCDDDYYTELMNETKPHWAWL